MQVNRWDDLKDFVVESGFETLDEWIEVIKGFECEERKFIYTKYCIKQRKKRNKDV